jgi:hypothetical protein
MASAVADAPNLLPFIPLLGTGEVVAFGEGVPFPAHMRFSWLPGAALPRSDSSGRGLISANAGSTSEFVEAVVDRWRGATMTRDSGAPERMQAASEQPGSTGNASVGVALDKVHQRLLNRSVRS